MIIETRMQPFRIVIELNIAYDRTAGVLEVEMPDIRHLNFERAPKALNRLVVARRSRSGHTFAKAEAFHKLLRLLCGVLTASVAVKDRTVGANRIFPHSHSYAVLHELLTLMPCHSPPD